MMNTEIRQDREDEYLVLSEEQAEEETYQVKMLEGNHIPGCLHCRIQRMNGKLLFYYRKTGRISLEEKLSGCDAGKELVQRLFLSVAAVADTLADYLLDSSGLILRPDCIFLDEEQKQVSFCFFPFSARTMKEQLKELGEYLLPRLDRTDQDAVAMEYAFYGYCAEAGEKRMSTEMFRKLLIRSVQRERTAEERRDRQKEQKQEERERLLDAFFAPEEEPERTFCFSVQKEKGIAAVLVGTLILTVGSAVLTGKREMWVISGIIVGVVICFVVYCRQNRQESGQRKMQMEQKENFGSVRNAGAEVSVGEERIHRTPAPFFAGDTADEETVYLREERHGAGETGEKNISGAVLIPDEESGLGPVSVGGVSFRIGKSRRYADGQFLSGAVSRLHAEVFRTEEGYFVRDLNSRNGTFVNEKKVKEGESLPIHFGDRIRFGDVNCRFEEKI